MIKTYGSPVRWSRDYRELLRERDDVVVHSVAGCSVTTDLLDFAAGYNSVSQEYLLQKFGKYKFEECIDDVERIYRENLESAGDESPLRRNLQDRRSLRLCLGAKREW